MSQPNLFLRPLAFLLLQKSVVAILVGFTSANSILRLGIFPLFILCSYYFLPLFASCITVTAWLTFVVGSSIMALLEYQEKLLLSQWSFDDYGPRLEMGTRKNFKNEEGNTWVTNKTTKNRTNLSSSGSQGGGTVWERLKFGVWVAMSFRYIGSPYQGRKIPPYDSANPSYVPTRAAFLWNQTTTLAVCYLIIDLMLQANQPEKNPVNYSEKQIPFISRMTEVTREEVFTRIITITFYWVGIYISIKFFFAGLSLLSVASGFDDPALYRPVNGPSSEAYTLRGFWGTFWHQTMRKMCTKPARYITFKVFQLPRTMSAPSLPLRLISRYTELTLVFYISGLLHLGIDTVQGISWRESGAVRFFVMMAVGIMLEDGVQWAFRVLTSRKNTNAVWAKVIGYIWVLLYLSWATPIWAYPALRRNTGGPETEIFPFSVFGLLRETWAGSDKP